MVVFDVEVLLLHRSMRTVVLRSHRINKVALAMVQHTAVPTMGSSGLMMAAGTIRIAGPTRSRMTLAIRSSMGSSASLMKGTTMETKAMVRASVVTVIKVATHKSEECPMLAMPKPTGVMYGLANDNMLFMDLPKTPGIRPKPDSGKMGRIRISGGFMTDRQVLDELKWLVPGEFQWDISQIDASSFRVVYPTKQDMARVRKIKAINVEGTSNTIHFENWETDSLDKWEFTDVWVRFHCCPDELRRDYLALFALGSLIGKTKKVDMKFTREKGIVRQLISVINPKAIPARLDHSYDGEGFGVDVEVEGNGDLVMGDANDDDNNALVDDRDDNANEDTKK
ncbi:hypothetical protein ACQ4PT_024158 [Festuca glaucescens]